jgi:hypothetical protein
VAQLPEQWHPIDDFASAFDDLMVLAFEDT